MVAALHLMHGKTSVIHHDGSGLFAGLPNPFEATRYHSLVVRPESVPAELEVTATSTDGVVMGVRPHAGGRGGAVPPGVGPDPFGPGAAGQFPRAARGRGGGRRRLSPQPPGRRRRACEVEVVGLVVVVDDGVVVVVVVVVADWQTEIVTVVPLLTSVPEAGLWLSTLPGCAPPAHVVSVVWFATRPATVIADWAELADCPTTLGTETQVPVEMTRLTAALGWTLMPGAGLCNDTTPIGTGSSTRCSGCRRSVRRP